MIKMIILHLISTTPAPLRWLPEVWAYVEPMIWLAGAIYALVWYLRKKLSIYRFRKALDLDKSRTTIVVQVGRDIAAQVARTLGDVDYVISWEGVLATESDYAKVMKDVKEVLKKVEGEVNLVVAAPLALAFMIGQEMGKYKSHVIFYQFSAGKYVPIDTWRAS